MNKNVEAVKAKIKTTLKLINSYRKEYTKS